MCVYSMVADHYQDKFNPYFPPVQPPVTVYPTITYTPYEIEELRELIREFMAAIRAARIVDHLTDQPDCEDPEKAKLEERVKRLEEALFGGQGGGGGG